MPDALFAIICTKQTDILRGSKFEVSGRRFLICTLFLRNYKRLNSAVSLLNSDSEIGSQGVTGSN